MADLSEYLGHILCEVTRARVMADLEAMRVAKEYVGDENKLLRSFPVPRMRLPTLEIVVPVKVDDIPDGYVEKTSVDSNSLAKALVDELGPALLEQKIQISTADVTKAIKEDPMLSQGRLYQGLADALSTKLYDNVRAQTKEKKTAAVEKAAGESFKGISQIIRERIDKVLSGLPRRPAGITVEPRTAALREVTNPALLVNIKLTVSEDALDIHLEDEGAASDSATGGQASAPTTPPRIRRLVPE